MLPCLEVQGARVKFFNEGPFWPEEVAGRGAGSGLKVKGGQQSCKGRAMV